VSAGAVSQSYIRYTSGVSGHQLSLLKCKHGASDRGFIVELAPRQSLVWHHSVSGLIHGKAEHIAELATV
jgi:hypothetical protein